MRMKYFRAELTRKLINQSIIDFGFFLIVFESRSMPLGCMDGEYFLYDKYLKK